MKHPVTGLVAALLSLTGIASHATAAPPFVEVPMTSPPAHSNGLAYASLAAGVASIASSFVFANRADQAYQDYLAESDPDRIERLWSRTVLNDRLSSGLLLGGEALLAAGLYLRFLRDPSARDFRSDLEASPRGSRGLSPPVLGLGPDRCALVWRF